MNAMKPRPDTHLIVLLIILCLTSVLFTLTLFVFVRDLQFPARQIYKQSDVDYSMFLKTRFMDGGY